MTNIKKRRSITRTRAKGISLRITAKQHRLIAKFAVSNDMTIAKVFESALSEYMGKEWVDEPEDDDE